MAIKVGCFALINPFNALVKTGFDGHSTLEIAGEEAVLKSFDYLKKLGAVWSLTLNY